MLTYRSVFEIDASDAFKRIVEPSLYEWMLKRKGFDLDTLSPRWRVSEASRASLVEYESASNRFRRLRLEEGTGYTTTVTTIERRNEPSRFWIDIDSPPDGAPAMPPAFLRDVLSQVTGRDGKAHLAATAPLLSSDDIAELIEWINDDERRGVLFVAGTSSELPLAEWRKLVESITWASCGMASTVVLDAEATQIFNELHSPKNYQVPPGTVRSFQPGAHLDDETDFRRNKILGTGRIVDDSEHYLNRVLASVARRAIVALPLTKVERDALRALDRSETAALLGLDAVAAPVSTPPTGVPQTPEAKPEAPKFGRRKTDHGVQLEPSVLALGNDLINRIVKLVSRAYESRWNRGPLDPQALDLIDLALANDPKSAQDDRIRVGATVADLQQRIAEAQELDQETRRALEDIDLELALQREDNLRAEHELRHLRRALAQAGAAAPGPDELPADPRTNPPTSFAALQEYVELFEHLVFTCDWDETAELDNVVLGSTSRILSLWECFIALDDYVAAKDAKDFTGSFYEYIQKCPDGYATIPKSRFAANESETVKDGRRSMRERTFVVPKEVDPSGYAEMISHLRAGPRTTDPRAYFVDTSVPHGYIVVGYIGRHLDVKSTN